MNADTLRIAYKPGLAKAARPGFSSVMLAVVIAATCLFQSPALAGFPDVEFSADSIENENVRIDGLRLEVRSGTAVRIESWRVHVKGADRVVEGVALDGSLSEVVPQSREFRLLGNLRAEGFEATVELDNSAAGIRAVLNLERQSLSSLEGIEGLPVEIGWLSRGLFDARLQYAQVPDRQAEILYQVKIEDLSFDSPQGRFAGEALYLEAAGAVQRGKAMGLSIAGTIRQGELLVDNFYRDFSTAGLEFKLEPEWRETAVEIRAFRLTDHDSLTVEGRAALPLGSDAAAPVLEISRLDLKFPGAYQRYIEPAVASWTLDGLGVTGSVSWSGEWSGGIFNSGDLDIQDLTIVDTRRNRFAVTGLEARLRPGDHEFESRLNWRGLLFGRINLGSGDVALDSEPGAIALVRPLALDVLGGRLMLHELRVVLPGSSSDRAGEPDIRLRADLQELDMEQLTAAMGWPSFAGKVSGEVPGVRLEGGVLEVDGEILVNVFDGVISMQDLRVERPFGVLPSLAGNIELGGLDLQLLTSTFSFGQISGRLDGYVRDLRMLDWRPVAFDAWLGTPESQQEKNDISRQAVNHLTTIGGGRATTALTSPLMRMFNKFSYRRLGLGCQLQNNTCTVRGIGEDEVSVLILEGAGVPKITIRAFNRRVDWEQMVANLLAISGEESIKVGN